MGVSQLRFIHLLRMRHLVACVSGWSQQHGVNEAGRNATQNTEKNKSQILIRCLRNTSHRYFYVCLVMQRMPQLSTGLLALKNKSRDYAQSMRPPGPKSLVIKKRKCTFRYYWSVVFSFKRGATNDWRVPEFLEPHTLHLCIRPPAPDPITLQIRSPEGPELRGANHADTGAIRIALLSGRRGSCYLVDYE